MPTLADAFLPRDVDLITGQSLRESIEVIDLGAVPVPGLFFPTAAAAAAAVSRVRLVISATSDLIELDGDINPALYSNYKSGAATAAHLDFVDSLAEVFSERYSPTARILEIGGNAGHFMRALRQKGFQNLYTIDPCRETQDNDEFTVIHGLFPEAISDHTTFFDVVVGQHVLEHSADPVAMLRAARNLLAPAGEVWIEVPDIVESARADGGRWLSIVYALHSAYFDTETLALACAYAGLQVFSIRGVNHYGKSLLAVCGPSHDKPPMQVRRNAISDYSVVDSIRRYFFCLQEVGGVPSGTLCWAAAERCIAVLGACMTGGFVPGAIIDSNSELHGLYVSGMNTPVLNPSAMTGPLPAGFMLSPQNASAIIAANNRLFSAATRIYMPVAGQ